MNGKTALKILKQQNNFQKDTLHSPCGNLREEKNILLLFAIFICHFNGLCCPCRKYGSTQGTAIFLCHSKNKPPAMPVSLPNALTIRKLANYPRPKDHEIVTASDIKTCYAIQQTSNMFQILQEQWFVFKISNLNFSMCESAFRAIALNEFLYTTEIIFLTRMYIQGFSHCTRTMGEAYNNQKNFIYVIISFKRSR